MKRLVAILRRPLCVFAIAGLALAAGVGAGTYALASPNGTDGTISICVNHTNGVLYQAAHCKAHDTKLTWNVTGPAGPAGVQYVWSSYIYPHAAGPQSDGHVATFTFSAPKAGYVLVTAQFQVRVHDNGSNDCHIESLLAKTPEVISTVDPTQSTPGFVDEWINANLPTQFDGGTYLGQNMSVSKVFHVVAGSNTIYLNGQFTYGTGGPNCINAVWGPITMSAVFANKNPASTLTAP